MANYNVDIAIGIKNAQALKKFNKEVKQTSLIVDGLNEGIRKASNAYEKSLNTLSSSLNKAKVNINKAAVGTDAFRKSALDLVRAEKSLNKELQIKNKLLNEFENINRRISPTEKSIRRNQQLRERKSVQPLNPAAGNSFAAFSRSIRGANQYGSPIFPGQAVPSNLRSPLPPSSPLPPRSSIEPGQSLFGQSVSIEGRSERIIKERFALTSKLAEMTERDIKAKNKSVNIEERLKKGLQERKDLSAALEKMEKRSAKNLKDQVKQRNQSRKIGRDNVRLKIKEAQATRKLAESEALASRTATRRRMGSTASSAIIGGAFPLLFGQTGAAAVGGGLGGLAGGAIGGQFGFALSILGTAIGSAIDKNDKFNQSLAALNVRFSDVSGGAQLTAKDIDAVAKRLRITKEEAFGVLGAFAQFGSGSIATSLTEIFGADAGAFDSVASANRQAQLANQIFEARTKIGNEVATQLLNQNLITDSATIELALAEARAKAENDIAVAQAKQITFLDRFRDIGEELLFRGGGDPTRYGEGRANKLQKEFEEGRNQRMKDFKEALEQVRKMLGLVNEANSKFGQSGVLAFSAIEDKVKDLQDEMKKLANPIYMVMTLSETMANSFEQSFKGIIKGTMSVSDAFRNMLNRIADHFLDTAARMMANQLQQSLLGLFSNIFLPNPYGVKKGQSLYDVKTPSKFTSMTVGERANGGPVMKGGNYLVGERGPELFSPGVSGTITPNEMLGGSTSIVVNVDASGSSVEGDAEQSRELGRLISVAIQSELIKQKRPGGMLA